MRTYSKFHTDFWHGASGKALRRNGDAQRVLFHLKTNPHGNMLGLYYCPAAIVSHEVGLSLDATERALAALAELDAAHYDDETETVWLPGEAFTQVGVELKPGDNRTIGVQREYEALHANPFLESFFNLYREAFHLKPRPDHRSTGQSSESSPFEAPSEPLRSHMHIHKQNHKQTNTASAVPSAPPPRHELAPGRSVGQVELDKLPDEQELTLAELDQHLVARGVVTPGAGLNQRVRALHRAKPVRVWELRAALGSVHRAKGPAQNYLAGAIAKMRQEGAQPTPRALPGSVPASESKTRPPAIRDVTAARRATWQALAERYGYPRNEAQLDEWQVNDPGAEDEAWLAECGGDWERYRRKARAEIAKATAVLNGYYRGFSIDLDKSALGRGLDRANLASGLVD